MNETPPISASATEDTLAAALARHAIALPAEQAAQLEKYCRLLWDWNDKLNLTRHTDFEKFVARDLVDSLALSRLLSPGEEVLDVGTGGGVPGLVVAIIRPDLQVSLCDSVGKKIRAVEQMAADLGLAVTTYPFRGEELLEDARFDAALVRAVGPLWKLLTWFKPRWDSLRRMLVLKGPKWREELAEAKRRGLGRGLEIKLAAQYPMPGTDAQSVVLKIWPTGTPER